MNPIRRLGLAAVVGLLAIGAAPAVADNATRMAARHYEYLLYLRAGPARDPVAQARAGLPGSLQHHRLVEPAALRQWNGQGPVPVALEARSVRAADLAGSEIFDTGEPLAEVLGSTGGAPVTALAVLIGVPPPRDVAAYAEALHVAIGAARALRAPAFRDGETGETLRIESLARRPDEGRAGLDGRRTVSPSNPPVLTLMDGITAHQPLPQSGSWSTRGLRKLGLPDLVLRDWLPQNSPHWVLGILGNLLLSGKADARADAVVTVRADDAEVAAELRTGARRGGEATVRWADAGAPAAGPTPRPLEVVFEGPAALQLYERQALFSDALWQSPYRALPPAQARELTLSVARVKTHVRELRGRYAALRSAGARVFVAWRMDLLVADPARLRAGTVRPVWEEVTAWSPDGRITLRRWNGDPRRDGTVRRLEPPLVIGGTTFLHLDSDGGDEIIEDVLVIDAAGRAEGGEVTALALRLATGSDERPSR